jgi:hypothetical protein
MPRLGRVGLARTHRAGSRNLLPEDLPSTVFGEGAQMVVHVNSATDFAGNHEEFDIHAAGLRVVLKVRHRTSGWPPLIA